MHGLLSNKSIRIPLLKRCPRVQKLGMRPYVNNYLLTRPSPRTMRGTNKPVKHVHMGNEDPYWHDRNNYERNAIKIWFLLFILTFFSSNSWPDWPTPPSLDLKPQLILYFIGNFHHKYNKLCIYLYIAFFKYLPTCITLTSMI